MVSAVGSSLDRQAFARFADLLDYPSEPVSGRARACAASVREASPEAAALLEEFAAYAEEQSLGTLQEVYTGAFDLDAVPGGNVTCYPYVGHHLFGESHVRSRFLVELRRRFLAHGFSVEREMSDHVVVLLQFMARCDDDELVGDLIGEALLPALGTMLGEPATVVEAADPPNARVRYQRVLHALRLTLASSTNGARTGAGTGRIARAARSGRLRARRERV
ncbi:MAG: molecular chaperone TorD family protein [Gaiellales bacterium]